MGEGVDLISGSDRLGRTTAGAKLEILLPKPFAYAPYPQLIDAGVTKRDEA